MKNCQSNTAFTLELQRHVFHVIVSRFHRKVKPLLARKEVKSHATVTQDVGNDSKPCALNPLEPREDHCGCFSVKTRQTEHQWRHERECHFPLWPAVNMNEEWPMPLLCISLLALLLLPLSLSCDNKRTPKEVKNDYTPVVQPVINNVNVIITTSLQNSSCPALKHRIRGCTVENEDIVSTLHSLTCKMRILNLNIYHTHLLITTVLNSVRCPCHEKPTKEPSMGLRRRKATRKRRNNQKKKEIKKRCKAEAILSAMTNCYQMLNTILADTWDQAQCEAKPCHPCQFSSLAVLHWIMQAESFILFKLSVNLSCNMFWTLTTDSFRYICKLR